MVVEIVFCVFIGCIVVVWCVCVVFGIVVMWCVFGWCVICVWVFGVGGVVWFE